MCCRADKKVDHLLLHCEVADELQDLVFNIYGINDDAFLCPAQFLESWGFGCNCKWEKDSSFANPPICIIFLIIVSRLHMVYMLDKMFQIINVSIVALRFHDLSLEIEVNFSTT